MHNLTAALLMTASMAAFAVEDAVIKHLSASLPVGMIMMLIGIMGATVFGTLAARQGQGLFSAQALKGAVLLRNLAEMIGAGSIVLAIALAPLSVVTAILQTMPLAVTLGAAVILRERVGWRRWSAIALGFAGVLVILRPGSQAFDPAATLAVITVIALSARDLATRRAPAAVNSTQLSGWGFLAASVGGLVLLAIRGEAPEAPGASGWAFLILAAAAGSLGYAALVQATRLGAIAVTTPFRYTRLLFAMAIGIAVFGERPDAPTLIGSAMIVAAGLYTLWREMLHRRPSSRG